MKTKRVCKPLLFLSLILFSSLHASAIGFSKGDILIALTDGTVQVRAADGTLKGTISGPIQAPAKGLAVDSDGNLLVSYWFQPGTTTGNTVRKFLPDGSDAGAFGSSYNCNPSGIAVDKTGNVYVGNADCLGDISRFSKTGLSQTSFDVGLEKLGARWIELSSDDCTIYYTSAGQAIQRYDVCTKTQLTNFNGTALPAGGAEALGLRITPDGGVLVADTYDIRRLDAAGNAVGTYDAVGDNGFVGIFIDPDGQHFWASSFDTSNVYKFDLITGQIKMSFNAGVSGARAKGIIIVPGEGPPPPPPPPSEQDGRMTGGGNFAASNGTVVHHGFELRCDAGDSRQNLEVNWGNGENFHLLQVTTVTCHDDPAIDQQNPEAPIDTLILTGTGKFNGQDGATISLTFTDAGEPGINDGVQMQIQGPSGTVLTVGATTLIDGNHQAHKANGNGPKK
jgi:hypothetical protein